MNVINVESGSVAIVWNPDEVRPLSGSYAADLLRAIGERYAFGKRPTIDEVVAGNEKFLNGRLLVPEHNKHIVIARMSAHSDGIVVDSAHTDLAEIAVKDLWEWLQATFRYRAPTTTPLRFIYTSHVVVDFDPQIGEALRRFESFWALAQEKVAATYKVVPPVYFTRATVGVDPAVPGAPFKTDFVIERRSDFPYAANRFFCQAPLKTNDHLQILEAFEAAAKAGAPN